ncbi:MAG: hypothetical protein PHF57_14315 [Methanoregula sp.]|nr:hypothetical protein [Methanoregula sp.]
MVDNEIIIIGAFLGSGMLAYVNIPGMLVIWERVLDHMEHSGPEEQKKAVERWGCNSLPFFTLLSLF